MKLIGRYDSPFVRRVGVSLHVLGLPFEHVPLSPFSQAAEFRRFAPVGRMPTLVLDDGDVLIDSAAILDCLDELAGAERVLLPQRGLARRQCLRILASATAACDKAIAINYERRRPAALIWSHWIARCHEQLDAALRELEDFQLALDDRSSLTQREITVGCALAYIRRVEPEALELERYPCLDRLHEACERRAAFAACPQ